MIYLDNAATSYPKPESVYQAMDAFLRTRGANPGRAGLHCAPWAHQTLGTYPEGALRLSISFFNTISEVEQVVEALKGLAS